MKNYQADEPCLVCGEEFLDVTYHHVESRGAGGSDKENNLMPLCFEHHEEIHKKGLTSFSNRFSVVAGWLRSKGWEKDPFGDWFLPLEKK